MFYQVYTKKLEGDLAFPSLFLYQLYFYRIWYRIYLNTMTILSLLAISMDIFSGLYIDESIFLLSIICSFLIAVQKNYDHYEFSRNFFLFIRPVYLSHYILLNADERNYFYYFLSKKVQIIHPCLSFSIYPNLDTEISVYFWKNLIYSQIIKKFGWLSLRIQNDWWFVWRNRNIAVKDQCKRHF